MNHFDNDDTMTPQNTPEHPISADDLNDPDWGLSDKQCMAIEMLAAGKYPAQVARVIEVDRKTLYVWRQKEPFRRALVQRRRQLWGSLSVRLRGLAHPSLDELEKQLFDRYDRARYRAATAILRLIDVKKCPDPDEEDGNF
jgi:hypothetical protein